jgi:hypothetical protein
VRTRRAAGARVVLTTFATAEYYEAAHWLVESARPFLDGYLAYRDVDLPRQFVKAHARHFADGRGYGYWTWKPFVLKEAIEQLAPGDVVIYSDAGSLMVADPAPLVDLCRASELGILLFDNRDAQPDGERWTNRVWTRRECFRRLGLTGRRYEDGPQVNAAFIVLEHRPEALAFLEEFANACDSYEIVSDMVSTTAPEDQAFRDHRHDQSILSLLAIRDDISLACEPSEYGNHLDSATRPFGQVWKHHRSGYRLPGDEVERLRRRARLLARARRLRGRRPAIHWYDEARRPAAPIPPPRSTPPAEPPRPFEPLRSS